MSTWITENPYCNRVQHTWQMSVIYWFVLTISHHLNLRCRRLSKPLKSKFIGPNLSFSDDFECLGLSIQSVTYKEPMTRQHAGCCWMLPLNGERQRARTLVPWNHQVLIKLCVCLWGVLCSPEPTASVVWSILYFLSIVNGVWTEKILMYFYCNFTFLM